MNNTAKTRLSTGWKIYIIAGMVAFLAVIAYYTYRVLNIQLSHGPMLVTWW